MTQVWLVAAAVVTLATAFAHSYFGERRLIGPLFAADRESWAFRWADRCCEVPGI